MIHFHCCRQSALSLNAQTVGVSGTSYQPRQEHLPRTVWALKLTCHPLPAYLCEMCLLVTNNGIIIHCHLLHFCLLYLISNINFKLMLFFIICAQFIKKHNYKLCFFLNFHFVWCLCSLILRIFCSILTVTNCQCNIDIYLLLICLPLLW